MRTVVLVLLCLVIPAQAGAWVQSTSSQGAGLHWTTNCVAVYVNDAGSDDVSDNSELDAVQNSINTWREVECSSFDIQYAGKTNMDVTGYYGEDPTMNLVTFREKWPHPDRPVAYTAVTYDPKTGEIRDADIELNGEDFRFTTNPAKEPWKIDVENTVTHELGHVLGLDHTDDDGESSTMYGQADPGESKKRTLEPDDIEGLCTIYPAGEGVSCPVLTPKYVYYDGIPLDEGCSAGPHSRAGASVFLLLILLLMSATGLARREA